MKGRHILLAIALGGLLTTAGASVRAGHHEGPVTPESFEETKLLADEAYETRRFKEAFDMYQATLARHGDAYGQYMTGIMMRAGQGTDRDIPTGTAWMLLAAEQGNSQILEAANLAAAELRPGDERRANKILRDLRRQYSNCALLDELVDELKDSLKAGGRGAPVKSERITAVYGDVGSEVASEELTKRLKLQQKNLTRHCTRY